ncbi:hypothetical protein ACTJJ7_12205 [Phyllobacterium sp. 22229]|uniref:hypothetical protein n=1 Tax=Hyphomicrobiales TaxID=356 RepID=UPI003EBD7163
MSVKDAKIVTVYAATTRERDASSAFTSGRAQHVSYLRNRISIPPGHKSGNIEWPKSKPDPKTDFVSVEQQVLDRTAFEHEVSRKRGSKPPGIGVFTHGYNTNYTEAVFRMGPDGFRFKYRFFSFPVRLAVRGKFEWLCRRQGRGHLLLRPVGEIADLARWQAD